MSFPVRARNVTGVAGDGPGSRPRRSGRRLGRGAGFSLLEMAITLAILGILLTGLLPSLSAYRDDQRRWNTEKSLQQIRQMLLAYAAMQGRLPCPAREEDPASADYGLEDCAASVAEEGYLPWRSLGVAATDAWGQERLTAEDPWRNHWLYRVDSLFAVTPFSLDDIDDTSSLRLEVRDGEGRPLTNRSQPPAALICSMGANGQPDGGNASVESAPQAIYQLDRSSTVFDDICLWVSRPMLVSALLWAGRLP